MLQMQKTNFQGVLATSWSFCYFNTLELEVEFFSNQERMKYCNGNWFLIDQEF
jgi:hypothetical protein